MPTKRPNHSAKGAPKPKKQRIASNKAVVQKAQTLKSKGKQKAIDRVLIPIPNQDNDEDVAISGDDKELVEQYGNAIMFLDHLDYKGIARSKQETERLLLKEPRPKAPIIDDLPSLDSDSGEEAFSSGVEDDDLNDDISSNLPDSDSDIEMPYEGKPRELPQSWKLPSTNEVESLPIKLADGRLVKTGNKKLKVTSDIGYASEGSSSSSSPEVEEEPPRDDVTTGPRFGRAGIFDIVGNTHRKARIMGAKEQIASLCQDIIADPENSLGLLRRLGTFSLAEITSPTHPEPIHNDTVIRKLAILSQLAVFKDVIPGYRIRALTDKEKAEKVSQMVARTRDWEQGLVGVYQTYLQGLEAEVKAKSDLSSTALRCMCILLTDVTHFNFRVNLMQSIIAILSRKSWDESSILCLETIIKVFQNDLTGQPSLEIVRLLNRMIKEKRFNVHPNVLTCLLSLRLTTELGVRASDTKVSSDSNVKRSKKEKKGDKPHLSKKAKKMLKERNEIEREFRDAEAEVDKEERASTQTETLKLVFVLYFRILKNDRPTPLLPAALRGISRFSHLVNIDFFKDLMQVLKNLILREDGEGQNTSGLEPASTFPAHHKVQHNLLCIITAFELLSGQGEALNLDLGEFTNCLYTEISTLSTINDIEATSPSLLVHSHHRALESSLSDLLFRALSLVFFSQNASSTPPWCSSAFGKRLLSGALHWPPRTVIKALQFVQRLVAKEPKLEALLTTDDRAFNGTYRPDINDPQACNPFGTAFWELILLSSHGDASVRAEAKKLMNYSQA